MRNCASCTSVTPSSQPTRKQVTCTFNAAKVIPSQVMAGVPSGPGVVVIAQNGSIVCDNTLGTRLALCYAEQTPTIREKLFGLTVKQAS